MNSEYRRILEGNFFRRRHQTQFRYAPEKRVVDDFEFRARQILAEKMNTKPASGSRAPLLVENT